MALPWCPLISAGALPDFHLDGFKLNLFKPVAGKRQSPTDVSVRDWNLLIRTMFGKGNSALGVVPVKCCKALIHWAAPNVPSIQRGCLPNHKFPTLHLGHRRSPNQGSQFTAVEFSNYGLGRELALAWTVREGPRTMPLSKDYGETRNMGRYTWTLQRTVWTFICYWQSTLIITTMKEDTSPSTMKDLSIYLRERLDNYISFVEILS